MEGNFSKQSLKIFTMLFLVWIPLTYAFPSPSTDDNMIHNNNYDMIMPDDHEPAESIHFQNFDGFFNAEVVANDAMSEMEMDESRNSPKIRAPQALSAKEKRLREQLEELDVQREKRIQRSLTKGSTRPRGNVNDWDQFDYEMFVKHR
ncbi:uncharacterized protein LOC119606288 [Lucilia sericata]|uniref:uncharacterized protein LOC119606288 n=1 Tax=Lucilia sericata TaxID=13632 RepID=UPI0018A834FF|nr:uncharacterized protein LOC119606288 [Lucilia sericata]